MNAQTNSLEFNFKNLADFFAHFKDEETCQRHFAAIRFRNGEYCPHCRGKKIHLFKNGKRYRCAKCRQDFTIKTGTIFGESKLPLQKWFIAIYLLSTSSKGISSVQLAKQIGVTQKTGWFMDHRIREAIKQGRGKLTGIVEADETYVGGKEKNKHASKRLKAGRGAVGKSVLFGVRKRTGNVHAVVLPCADSYRLHGALDNAVKKGSVLYTDDFRGYRGLKNFVHTSVNHSEGQYVDGKAHTNSIESFWALFKRGYHGIYHQMSKKHLQRYVDEYVYRFNRRGQSLQPVFSDVVKKVSQSGKLGYRKLTENPPAMPALVPV